jgi:hypothetical protein
LIDEDKPGRETCPACLRPAQPRLFAGIMDFAFGGTEGDSTERIADVRFESLQGVGSLS